MVGPTQPDSVYLGEGISFPHQCRIHAQVFPFSFLSLNWDISFLSFLCNQKIAISNSRYVVEDSNLDLYCTSLPENLNIAGLGCTSGSNTLLVIKEIIDAIYERCRQIRRGVLELRVYLNDLLGNDFNSVFRSVPVFCDTLKKEKGLPPGTCFIAGVPSSFYGRLFPRNFLDFVHSSYSVHWLSQVSIFIF